MKQIITIAFLTFIMSMAGMAQTPFTISYSFETGLSPEITPQNAPITVGGLFTTITDITFQQTTEEGFGVLKISSPRPQTNPENNTRFTIRPNVGKSFTITSISLRHKKGANSGNYIIDQYLTPTDKKGLETSRIQTPAALPSSFTTKSYTVNITNDNVIDGLTLGFGFNRSTGDIAYWYIDFIEIQGTYDDGAVTEDIILSKTTSALKTSAGQIITDSVRVVAAGFTEDLNLSFSGINADLFSVDPEVIDVCEIEGGVWAHFSYLSETPGIHTATLNIGTASTSKQVEITGTSHLLYENFNKLQTISLNTDLSGNLLANYLSTSSGWTYQSLRAYSTGGGGGSVIITQHPGGEAAYLSTPPLDLSRNVTLSFMSRRVGNDEPPVYVKVNETVVYQFDRLTTTITTRTTNPFSAGANDVITFYSSSDTSCVVIDEVLVDYVESNNTGVQTPNQEENVVISVQKHRLNIQTAAPQTVYIYNSVGYRVVSETTKSNSLNISLPQSGIYIIKVGSYVRKIII